MVGGGYYWAINRSHDLTYRAQLFTQRGLAHHVDFRGKPNQTTDFNFILYGVKDRGLLIDGFRRPPDSGYILGFLGRSDLKHGWIARADVNYLSSFRFRQAFTESFYEVISSEVHTSANLSKYWETYSLDIVAYRVENFLNADDKVSLRRIPSIEFRSRDRQIYDKALPVWVSLNSSGSFVRRRELNNATREFVDRIDAEPRVTTALRWKEIHLIPPSPSGRHTMAAAATTAGGSPGSAPSAARASSERT
jgi:LPS-assembly protein